MLTLFKTDQPRGAWRRADYIAQDSCLSSNCRNMQKNNRLTFTRTSCILLVFTVLILNISACNLREIKQEINKAESAGVIQGKILLDTDQSGPVIVYRYSLQNKTFISDRFTRANFLGKYQFDSLPGTFFIAAFVDKNKDGIFQENEHGNFYSIEPDKPAPVSLKPGETVVVPDITIAGKSPELRLGVKEAYNLEKISKNIGRTISLYDPIFTESNYSMGMWQPLRFLEQVGGGLFFLQPYQSNKIPVIFIHGLNGGPLDWKEAIENLNPEFFQPWILYYPSGLKLDFTSDYLVQALLHLQDKYSFDRVFMAAHSLGGLVARSSIKKYHQQYPAMADSLGLLLTVNSPLKGMSSAAIGVQNSPIVLPVWRDLDPDSKFLLDLNSWLLPEKNPYHLVFSFKTDSTGDGVVPLPSQLPFEVQKNVVRMYGFNNTHVGTLKDKAFLDLFNSILDKRRIKTD